MYIVLNKLEISWFIELPKSPNLNTRKGTEAVFDDVPDSNTELVLISTLFMRTLYSLFRIASPKDVISSLSIYGSSSLANTYPSL